MEETNREALPLGPFYRDQRFMHMLRITAVAFAVLLVLAFVVGLLVPSIPAELAQQFRQTMDDAGVMNGDLDVFIDELILRDEAERLAVSSEN